MPAATKATKAPATPHAEVATALGIVCAGVKSFDEILANIERQAGEMGVSLPPFGDLYETTAKLLQQVHAKREPILQAAIKEAGK